MRLPRFRFTVRRMMAVVAIVGLMIAVGVVYRRAVFFRERTRHHTDEVWRHSWFAMEQMGMAYRRALEGDNLSAGLHKDEAQREWEMVSHHRGWGMRFEAASWRPWLPVEPEPAEPK